jgi:class 3 adenylate cyclase/predicted ATPase
LDIGQWLRSFGLDRYEAAFRENHVTVEVLTELTTEDLKELGVASIGHRRRLIAGIAALRDTGAFPLGRTRSASSQNEGIASSERRQITVLFCDIVGSTPLARGLDPEDLREVLTAYQASVAGAIAAQGGFVARFVGDGVLAYFGWPNADEAHAVSAVRAGLAIVEAMGPQQLSVRIGIATGLVLAGDLDGVGAAQRITAVGDTPNLAARLQTLAQPDTVVVSEGTRSQLGHMFELENLGDLSLKGFDTPVRAWRVRGATGALSRSETVYAGTVLPLVGRDEELNLLLHRWRQASAGEGRVVLLTGEAGIGKSRLLAALEEQLADEEHISLRYFCSPYHKDSPLYPIAARMERDAGCVRGDTAEGRLQKLEELLAPAEPQPADISLFAALLSIPTNGRYPSPQLSPQQRKSQTFAALMRRLSKLADNQPVLILFEDAHWSDPTSIELLHAVIEEIPRLAALLVISYRSDFAAPWFDFPNVSLMALNRLDRRDAETLVGQVVTHHVVSPPVLERIVTQSDGVPLFIEELTRAVLEAPGPGGSGATLAVPDTLQASLMARLDRLPGSKSIAQVGSVAGREFSHALLASVSDIEEANLERGLQQLIAAGLLFQRGASPNVIYTFKHALVRDVVYASLPKSRRQALHRKVAEAVRDEVSERTEPEPEVIAYHFTEAGLIATAIKWWSKAGDLALQRSAYIEAIAHLERALELANELDDTESQRISRLQLQISMGGAYRITHGFAAPKTQEAFARARAVAATIAADIPERLSAEYGLWSGSFQSGDLSAMRELADGFVHKVEPGSPEYGLAHRIVGMTHWFTGDFGTARPPLELALRQYDGARDRLLVHRFGQDLAVPALAYLAMTLWPLGECREASHYVEDAVSHALHTEHVPTIAYAYLHAAFFAMLRRDPLSCDRYVKGYLDLAHEHMMPLWLANGVFQDGWIRWHAGDHADGTAQMRDGLRLLRDQGQTVYLPLMRVRLAETEADDGRNDAALAAIDAELAEMKQSGQCWFLAEAHRAYGDIICRSGARDLKPAERAFASAISVARDQSAARFEVRAAESLARVWAGQGRSTEPIGMLAALAEGHATAR